MTMQFLKSVTLKVQLFAGTDVRDAANDLCQLADRVGALCEADFNGVKLWARPGDNPLRIADSYFEQIKRPAAHFKVAQDR